jgi:Ca2+-binding RTX toxin-like protein
MTNFTGTGGPDHLDGTGSADVIEGLAGDDVIFGNAGDDDLRGGDDNDKLFGGEDNDLLDGGAGNDELDGGIGHNIVHGGAGDDIIWYREDDLLDGGADIDLVKIDISAYGSTATLDLSDPSVDQSFLGTTILRNIERVQYSGGTGSDQITGGAYDDVIDGRNGDDILAGGGGNDILSGGDGIDQLSGGAGDDQLVNVESFDSLGYSLLDGGEDYDELQLRLANYTGTVDIDLGDASGAVRNIERIFFTGGSGVNTVIAAGAADIIFGGASGDHFEGLGGDDDIRGFGGDDVIYGGSGNDYLEGGSGADSIYGGDDDDVVRGGSLGSYLDGGAGNDEITGFGGADTLVGGSGDDTLDGGLGADSMTGGLDNDVYVVDNAGDTAVELSGEGTDEIRTGLATFSLQSFANVENLSAVNNVAHDFTGNAGDNVVTGGSGADTMRLQDGGNDRAVAGGGNDILYYGAAFTAADSNSGGSGTDVLVLQGNYSMNLDADALTNVEFLSLQGGSVTKFGDSGANSYDYALTTIDANVAAGQLLTVNAQSLQSGEDLILDGSAETDGRFLDYAGNGLDTLIGGAGNDIFFFEGTRWASGDTVDGGAGRDAVVVTGAISGMNNITFADDVFDNIESISVNARFASDPSVVPSYHLVVGDHNASNGALILNASSLSASQTAEIDASAVTDGNLQMFGGAGADVLTGGALADVIMGGLGGDTLYGGGGNDVFRYDSVLDSPAQDSRDGIQDFTSSDRIDLSRIDANSGTGGNDAFTFIGTDAFHGTAGELRAVNTAGPIWTVSGDVNGDSVADIEFFVVVTDSHPLAGADFVL